jgi:serine/threonine-protein kinase
MEDLSGKTLGRYQVIEPLGEGGMAAVYKAYQPGMERHVALKILPRAFARDPEFTGRFEQEAMVIAQLQHPHILPVHDYGEADSYTYIVMPMVDGGTLADLVRGKPPIPWQRIRQITAQVGDALDYAHAEGVVHRDVKPSNILIDTRGNCLLTDFGIAKMVKGTKHFTQTGGIVGTPHYMSPEQGSGGELTSASDIYSLGVVIYEMATGRVPFDAETPMAVVIKHMTDPLPPPSKLNPKLYPGLEAVILKAMAKEPEDRYETAADLVRAIKLAIPERAVLPQEREIETVPAPELVERERAIREAGAPAEPDVDVPSQPIPVPQPKPRRAITPLIIGAGVVLVGLCGVGAFGAYQLINAGNNASATENAAATQRAETEGQMTAVAADQIRTDPHSHCRSGTRRSDCGADRNRNRGGGSGGHLADRCSPRRSGGSSLAGADLRQLR